MKSPQTPKEESKTQLQEKLEILEKQWSTVKQQLSNPNPKKPSSLRRRSTSRSNVPMLERSPRGLMRSLQHKINDHDDDEEEEEDVIRKEIWRFDGEIKGKKLEFGEDEEVDSEVCSCGSCLDVKSESVESVKKESYRGRSRTMMMIPRVCIVIALMACCVVGSVTRIRFTSFGFGEEEMVLVPT